MKTTKSFKDSGLLIKGVTQTIKNKTKEQRGGFLGMLLSTLGTSFFENMLAYKRVIKSGDAVIRARHYFLYHLIS